jgi:hypothetical protein
VALLALAPYLRASLGMAHLALPSLSRASRMLIAIYKNAPEQESLLRR